jgi:hypothetical protein
LLTNRRIKGFHETAFMQVISLIEHSADFLMTMAGHMQVNKTDENYYLSDDRLL